MNCRFLLLCLSSFYILLPATLSAQTIKPANYTQWWKKIDSLTQQKGLYRSALTEIKALYKKAVTEKQEAQQVKALVYRLEIQEQLEEFSDTLAIAELNKAANQSKGATGAIFHTLLADYYKNYFDQHSWEIMGQATTRNYTKENIRSWGAADFHAAISSEFNAALKEEALLKTTSLTVYDPVIVKGNARNLRPFLYDLLAWKALEYYAEDNANQARAADAYTFNNPDLFLPAAGFVQHKFKTTDANDYRYKVLLLYQSLIRFHLKDKNTEALLDADLNRLRYMQENGVMPGKTAAYRKALEEFIQHFTGTAGADQANYLLAKSYAEQDQADYRKVVAICSSVFATKNETEGYANCYNLLQETKQPSLELTTEKVNLPDQPFRSLLSWRNLPGVHFRLIKITEALRKQLSDRGNYFDSAQWRALMQEKSIRTWEQALPASDDYAQHRTEVKVDALPVGEYLLLAASKDRLNLGDTYIAAAHFYVSSISFVNSGNDYFLLHRETGEPLKKASVQVWYRKYNYDSRRHENQKGGLYQTNDQGYLGLPDPAESRNLRLDISYKEDHLFLDDEVYQYVYNPRADKNPDTMAFEAKHARVYFFTDRSIYRPGQTLHFKGIAVTKGAMGKRSKAYSGQNAVVILYNANGEKIDSLELTTNNYGSYNGIFKLPETGLTGSFRLEDRLLNGSTGFRVEDYKRPKFFVEYLPQKGSYRVNDSVTVKGFAKAYAGNAINSANITYRVTRIARFLYPWRYEWKPITRGSRQEISNGRLTTAADGSFSISFLAIPDEQLDKKTDPVFDYEVTADVTDLNGETRSAITIIPVSYKALQVQVSTAEQMMASESFKQVIVKTRNISGEFEAANVQLELRPLQSPGRLVRSRFWQQPDLYAIPEAEFLKWFPHDEYRHESDPSTWPAGAVVWKIKGMSTASGQVAANLENPVAGWYQVTATALDRYGDTVKDVTRIFLYDRNAKQLPVPSYLTAIQDRQSLQPGETGTVTIGSSAGRLIIIQQKEAAAEDGEADSKQPFSEKFKILSLDNSLLNQSFTATEADRGGVGFLHFFVKDNRFYLVQNGFAIPWLNKELDIRVNTYRDKTLPGSEEKWTISIKGNKGEKVAAELLTSMYDASLDQFAPHKWNQPSIWPLYWNRENWRGNICFALAGSENNAPELKVIEVVEKDYDELIAFSNAYASGRRYYKKGQIVMAAPMAAESVMDEVITVKRNLTGSVQSKKKAENIEGQPEQKNTPTANLTTRKDFRETAFFLPQLQSDTNGNYSFSFTMPEALTTWKWQLLAHTPDLAMGSLQKNIITQKELMVQPNMPRFLREGDRMEITTKIVNLSNAEMTGQAELQLIDATTNQPMDGWFNNFFPNQYFTVAPGSSELVKFPVEVPYLFDKVLTWKIIARSGNYSDGEEAALPVLSNRQLVTESMPFFINGSGTKNYDFKKLSESGESESLSHRALTVEFTANPAWYAVQALPYLADYPYECAEQSFNRLYGNLLAASIVDRLPKIKSILEKWESPDTSALLSNLQKNSELKQVLLEETPWVLEAKSETEQKRQIAQLFNLVQLAKNRQKIAGQLLELQTPNGGFSWFKGGPDDRYITQYIVTGIGHLKQSGAIPKDLPQLNIITEKALPYLDARIKEDYDKRDKKSKQTANLNYYAVQYYYMRSFFPEKVIPAQYLPAVNHYRKEIQQNWIRGNRMAKGMIALALFRTGDKTTAGNILQSLEQSAITSEEMGMYWKDNTAGYYWQDAPIETQALLIEAFSIIRGNDKITGALKAWLLRNKQSNNWRSTKATADACYALLLNGDNWLEAEPLVSVQLGTITTVRADAAEAGTGYYKKQIPGTGVFPEMGKIKVTVEQPNAASRQLPVWGAVYWQYFENLEKITPAASPLRIKKIVMVERATKTGPVSEPVIEGQPLAVGDKLKVRLELTSDRAMEYVHLKDMRASALEPVNVLSSYKWQGGLGYYESTRDASTNFFISYLPKGTYVMEYALFVSHTGVFSNGISTVQCMYAPEFTSHSEGIKITVE
ncbi:alpha-2-macroglobulin family protein [Flavihumibacter profundi]|uniref:alpha-2-macroglobulin family protein n=1 Tax=Flavihumibacter profundi TaxID=2716883 RepID=UPI001CC4F772|nr:alpha-2-macroglobulin family protein [Flavihumibacter profundi]MBZ5857366.1 alpha-2-macroglobulin [Flavihumibacter profundi]